MGKFNYLHTIWGYGMLISRTDLPNLYVVLFPLTEGGNGWIYMSLVTIYYFATGSLANVQNGK